MKHLAISAILLVSLLPWSRAEEARFFRISGPVTSSITTISANGDLTWTNTAANAVFTVQTIQSLNQKNWLDYIHVPCSNATTIHRVFDPNPPSGMAFIPAGSFTMGDAFNDYCCYEYPAHTIYVSAFYMERYELTKALWDEVFGWAITHGYSFQDGAQGKAAAHPAHSMSWYDAVKWCNARSEKEGRVPAYYTSAAQSLVYRAGNTNVQNDWVKWNSGYRLPTEAEWEKAARGGTSGHRFPWGNTIAHSEANYYSSSSYAYDISSTRNYHSTFNDGVTPYTSPVGYFGANEYGLYDMAGNVWEWCWDWYLNSYYSSSPGSDPRGPTSGLYRVLRGGGWDGHSLNCRTADRSIYTPSLKYRSAGFRSVLPAGQP